MIDPSHYDQEYDLDAAEEARIAALIRKFYFGAGCYIAGVITALVVVSIS